MRILKRVEKIIRPRKSIRKKGMKNADSLWAAIRDFQNGGFNLRVAYDIGAHVGSWSTSLVSALPHMRPICFEANAAHRESLQQSGFPFFISPLGSKNEEVEFYGKGGTGDSFYRENSSSYENVQPVKVQSRRLDDLLEENDLPLPDFIKIDTQGSELDVFGGGMKALSAAKMVYMECPLVPYNQGAPDISQYIGFMMKNDFLPHDILEVHIAKSVAAQIDILFVRSSMLFKFYPIGEEFYSPMLNSKKPDDT